jgi:hypothetical protein
MKKTNANIAHSRQAGFWVVFEANFHNILQVVLEKFTSE